MASDSRPNPSWCSIANAGELIPGLLGPRLPVRPDDGWLHVFVVRGGVVGSVARGARAALGRRTPGRTTTGSAWRLTAHEVSVEIDVEPPDPVQVDGDRVGTGRLEARLRPCGRAGARAGPLDRRADGGGSSLVRDRG